MEKGKEVMPIERSHQGYELKSAGPKNPYARVLVIAGHEREAEEWAKFNGQLRTEDWTFIHNQQDLLHLAIRSKNPIIALVGSYRERSDYPHILVYVKAIRKVHDGKGSKSK